MSPKIGALPDSIKKALINRAEKDLQYTWPALPASLYHEYKEEGNRAHYEDKLGERRSALSNRACVASSSALITAMIWPVSPSRTSCAPPPTVRSEREARIRRITRTVGSRGTLCSSHRAYLTVAVPLTPG